MAALAALAALAARRTALPAIGEQAFGSRPAWRWRRLPSAPRQLWWASSRRLPTYAARCLSSSAATSAASAEAAAAGKQLEVDAPVIVSDSLHAAAFPELKSMVSRLEDDARRAVLLAVKGHKAAELADAVELSVTICGDEFMRKLNKEWLGKDCSTDVLSFPQDQPPGEAPLLLLGDVVISIEAAARQAEERQHSLLDELRILLVHGLLHVLGYDHELGVQESQRMERAEQSMLSDLGWKGKGLISVSHTDEDSAACADAFPKARSAFKVLFCDMDGTLLNSKSRITPKTARALKAAIETGVQVILATGKTRHAAMAALHDVGLADENGAVSPTSPGVFLQGLLVYGRGGEVVHRSLLPEDLNLKTFQYAAARSIPVVGFCGDRTVAPFDDPFLRLLHETYFEPKPEVLESLEELTRCKIQKLLLYEKQEVIEAVLKPELQAMAEGRVRLVQAQAGMLEVLPEGQSKGDGVRRLLDHLQLQPDEAMAIGDGDNDVEMLQMVGWGVAMANAAPKALQAADVTVASNDQDGVAEAVERFLLA